MKIAIDISQIVYEGTGVARYTRNLVEAILQHDHSNEYVFLFSSLRQHLDEEFVEKIREKHVLKVFPFPPTLLNFVWNQLHFFSVNQLARISGLDIFISSDWTQPPLKQSTKSITVVHDLVYLKYPETLHPKIVAVQKKRMEWVKKDCDLIIADSQSTKQDLIDLLKIDEKRIQIVYPAVEIQKPNKEKIGHIYTKYNIQNTKYILTVGKLEPRKNITRLISAFQTANLKDTQLLIVGPEGWDLSFTQTQNTKYQIPNTIKFLGFVPDSDLYCLYAGAEFFLYPSLYEGFGYPIVEAMALGCPVATSNTSSMKEIAEGYGLLFDPNSEEDIIETIETLAENDSLRKKLSKSGEGRVKDFTLNKFSNSFNEALRLI